MGKTFSHNEAAGFFITSTDLLKWKASTSGSSLRHTANPPSLPPPPAPRQPISYHVARSPYRAGAVLQTTWDMDLLTRNAELCWMTPAKLPTKFKLCTTSKSETSLKKKIKKEVKKRTSAENEVWGLFCFFFFFFPSFCCGRGHEARVLVLKYTTANFQHEEIVEGRDIGVLYCSAFPPPPT